MKRLFLVLLMALSLGLFMGCEENTLNFEQAYETFDILYQENDNENHVTNHVTLLTRVEDIRITWETNEPSVIDQFGNVIRQNDDIEVVLTATLTYQGETKTKAFNVIVKGLFEYFDVIINQGDDITELRIKSGDSFDLPEVEEVEGYAFVGWFKDANKNTPYTHGPVTEDLTLYTKYEVITVSSYTVNYYFENIEDDDYTLNDEYSFTVQGNVGQRILTSIELFGLKINEDLSDLEGYVTATPQVFNVYFDRDTFLVQMESDGVMLYEAYQKFQSKISEITPEPKEDYIFLGWSISQTELVLFDFDLDISSNIHLYAKWQLDIDDEYTYQGYYEGADGLTDSNLVSFLHERLNQGFSPVDYGAARYILDDTDQDPNNPNNLILVYLGTSVSGAWDSGITWNREHVWPQSLLGTDASNSTINSASDLHNLKPANPAENSSRSNKYFDVMTGPETYLARAAVRGDIARILFYMDIMYQELSLVNSNPGVYQMGKKDVLLRWHLEDPVDDFERNRNDIIYAYQNNRNPFIDHPEFVEKVYGPIVLSSTNNDQPFYMYTLSIEVHVDRYDVPSKKYIM